MMNHCKENKDLEVIMSSKADELNKYHGKSVKSMHMLIKYYDEIKNDYI